MGHDGTAGLDGEVTDGPLDVWILAMKNQLYEEATKVFIQQNVVKIALGDNGGAHLSPPIFRDNGQGLLVGAPISKLKRIGIILPMSKVLQTHRLAWLLKRVCRAFANHSHLRENRITPMARSNWYVVELDPAMNGPLEFLKMIRVWQLCAKRACTKYDYCAWV